MYLTNVLMKKFFPRALPKGNIWRGKYRLVRKVTLKDLANVKYHLDIEEKNMFYLRHPYLKAEEYAGVDKHFLRVWEKLSKEYYDKRQGKFLKSVESRKLENHYPQIVNHCHAWE